VLFAMALAALALPVASASAAAGSAEGARVVASYGSGAAIVRNDEGQVYGVVYAGMDGSHAAQNVYSGFHDYAAQANGQRVSDVAVWVQPTGVMGQTPDGMLVLVGHLFLPGSDVPVAADLLGSGYGWYHPDPANAFDGLYAQLEGVARAQASGVWGWPTAVPNLGATPPPPSPTAFAGRPVPSVLADAWDVLVASSNGAHFAGIVQRSGVSFRMTPLSDSWAAYSVKHNLILLDRTLANEDPRAVATVLAHEITHAGQSHGPDLDCVQAEVEAFAVQARLWDELVGSDPPIESDLEQQLNLVLAIYRDGGEESLTQLIASQDGYQLQCDLAA